MSSPLVSVCIPLYNGEATIARAVDSVLASREGVGPVEVVVVDDGSSDRSLEVLNRYSGTPLLRVERNPGNLGLARNWDRALAAGCGDILTLLHMDDWYAPGCLAAVVEAFRAEPLLAMLAVDQRFHYPDGTEQVLAGRLRGDLKGREYAGQQLTFRDCPPPSTAFLRRSMLRELRPFYDPAYLWCPEVDLYVRLGLRFPEAVFRHDPRILVERGAGGGQFSQRQAGLKAIDVCRVLARYGGRLAAPEEIQASRQAAREAIAGGVAACLLSGDARQLLRILAAGPCWRWALRDPAGALWAAGNILRRGWRRLIAP